MVASPASTSTTLTTSPATSSTSASPIDLAVIGAGFDPDAVVGSLGPACSPEVCDAETVATWGVAEHSWNGKRGVLGLLAEADYGGQVAGLLRSVTRMSVDQWASSDTTGASSDPKFTEGVLEIWIASFYFGDHPHTGEPIVGDLLIGNPYVDEGGAGTVSVFCDYGDTGFGELVSSRLLAEGGSFESSFPRLGTQECVVEPIVPGRTYLLFLSTTALPPFGRDQGLAWLRSVHEYHAALLAAMQGQEYHLSSSGGVLGLYWRLSEISPSDSDYLTPSIDNTAFRPLLEPGVTLVVESSCSLCVEVARVLGDRMPNLPVHSVEFGSPLGDALGAVTAPTAFVANDEGERRGGAWVGQEIIDDLDGLLAQACRGLSQTDACKP
jgi:hypothetical protein